MVAIDLKPLSEETIQEMGFAPHDLWLVKIDSVVFGPFETETLKHYVQDNEVLFETAEASRTDESEWKHFWTHTKFQRRRPQVLSGDRHEGPFWTLDGGVKFGPFGFREIDKKLEMGLLGMTDRLSVDNGESWVKIYEISDFDRRSHVPEELPVAPLDSTLQRSRLQLIEDSCDHKFSSAEGLAELAWEGRQARVLHLKLDELRPISTNEQIISPTMKFAVPLAVSLVFGLISGAYLLSQDTANDDSLTAESEKPFYQRKAQRKGMGELSGGQIRMPASTGYARPSSGFQQTEHSSYPTQVITHEDVNNLPPPEHFDQQSPEAQPPQEHSLVTENTGTPEENSLDATMNGSTEAPQPVVEEASDF
jgi:hypothetical protein